MKTYKVTFLHTDGSIRVVPIEAINKKIAISRFEVNWNKDMKLISISEHINGFLDGIDYINGKTVPFSRVI